MLVLDRAGMARPTTHRHGGRATGLCCRITVATLSKRRLRRGSFSSLLDLQAAINHRLAGHCTESKAFRLRR